MKIHFIIKVSECPVNHSLIHLLIGESPCTVSHFFEILFPLLVFQLLLFRCVVSAIYLNVYLVVHIQEVRNVELAGLVIFAAYEDRLLKINVRQTQLLYAVPYLKFLFCGFLLPFLCIFVCQSINVLIL